MTPQPPRPGRVPQAEPVGTRRESQDRMGGDPSPPPSGKSEPGPSAPSAPPPPPRGGRRDSFTNIQEGLEIFLGGLALLFSSSGDDHCAEVIATRTELVAESWTQLARKNRGVKRALERMIEGGDWGQVIFASASLAIPIMEHHGLYPAGLPNPYRIFAGATADAPDAEPAYGVTPEDAAATAGVKMGWTPEGSQPIGEEPIRSEAEAERRAAERMRARRAREAAEGPTE